MRRRNAGKPPAIFEGRPLGDLRERFPYSETDVFHSVGERGDAPFYQQGETKLPAATQHANVNTFALYPFRYNGGISKQIVNYNPRRTLLIIQNQADTDLWVNFGANAATNVGILFEAGVGLVLDFGCPNNTISVNFPTAPTAGGGIIVEGAIQT